MKFIEMSGATLKKVVSDDDMQPHELEEMGIDNDSVVRVNPQGDIEVRRNTGWECIGGLLGEFAARIRKETGLDWAD